MKKIYFSPLIRETVVGVEVGCCGSFKVGFSDASTYVTMDGEE